jgi:hypothetical protein
MLAMLLMLSLNKLATSAMEHTVAAFSPAWPVAVKVDGCTVAVVAVVVSVLVGVDGNELLCIEGAVGDEAWLK